MRVEFHLNFLNILPTQRLFLNKLGYFKFIFFNIDSLVVDF